MNGFTPIASNTNVHHRLGLLIGAPTAVTIVVVFISKAYVVGAAIGFVLALLFWLSIPRKIVLNELDIQIHHFFHSYKILYSDVIEVYSSHRFMSKNDVVIVAQKKHKILHLPFASTIMKKKDLFDFFRSHNVKINS